MGIDIPPCCIGFSDSDSRSSKAAIVHTFFSSREDAFIKHDDHAKTKLNKKGEKPDKIYTLRQTGVLRKLLRSPSIASSGLRTPEEELEPTLFPNDTKPGVFPFLLMESKRLKGSSFETIDQQMAIIIHKSLSIQRRLHASACSGSSWTDSPLCWSLSHIGPTWRLAAGYDVNNSDGNVVSYHYKFDPNRLLALTYMLEGGRALERRH